MALLPWQDNRVGPRACTAYCLVTQISPVCPKFPGQVRLSILLCRWGKPHTAICSSVTAERAMQLLPELNWERLLQATLHFPYRLSGWEGPGATLSLSCELILLPVLHIWGLELTLLWRDQFCPPTCLLKHHWVIPSG